MSLSHQDQEQRIGFVTVVVNEKLGLLGGFLILNCFGRPVEFHCTAPVRANRAQEILYGNTLQSFLYGDQIAKTLLEKTKSQLVAVITDSPYVLAAAPLVRFPLGFVEVLSKKVVREDSSLSQQHDSQSHNSQSRELSESPPLPILSVNVPILGPIPGVDLSKWINIDKVKYRLVLPISVEQTQIEELNEFFQSVDPIEPFERIRLAIEEAQKAS